MDIQGSEVPHPQRSALSQDKFLATPMLFVDVLSALLGDPYCQSFTLYVCMCVCLSVCLSTETGTLKLKLKLNKSLDFNSSLSYGAPPAIWDHSVTFRLTQGVVPHLNPSQ